MRLTTAARKFMKKTKESSTMTAQQKRYEHKTNRVHHNRPQRGSGRTHRTTAKNEPKKKTIERTAFLPLFIFQILNFNLDWILFYNKYFFL